MMKREKKLWDITCLIAALSMFFAAMAEARPNQFFFLAKPMVGKHEHILTEMRHSPDPAFLWNMSRRVNHDRLGLSALQKERINAEFWKLYVHIIAIQYDASSRMQDVSEREDSIFRPESSASSLQVGQMFVEHFKAFCEILTPEQRHNLRKHKAAAKRFIRLRIEAETRALLAPAPSMPTAQSARFQSHAAYGASQHPAWGLLADADWRSPDTQDLQQLPILRL